MISYCKTLKKGKDMKDITIHRENALSWIEYWLHKACESSQHILLR